MTHRLTLALLVAGCGSTGDSDSATTDSGSTLPTIAVAAGILSVCAGTESPSGVGEGLFQVTGTVIGQGLAGANGSPVDTATHQPGVTNCASNTRYLTVEDTQGDLWHFGWSVTSGSGADLTAVLPLAPNDPVEIDFNQMLPSYSIQSGLAVRSSGALVGAFVSSGDLWEPLDTAALGGMTVTQGASMGQSSEPSGPVQWWTLEFTGDAPSPIDAGQSGSFALAGQSYVAHALSAWTRVSGGNTTCSDCAGTYVAWAAWRQ